MANPIQLKSHRVSIEAPRELVYQLMTAFGRGRLKGDNSESSRVISRDGDSIVAEFKARSGRFTYTTVERVVLEPPTRITFEHIKGPMAYAREEFVLDEADGRTELTHRGEFIWSRIPLVGWLGGLFYVKLAFERILEKHMERIKEASEASEARAARSHVFRSSGR